MTTLLSSFAVAASLVFASSLSGQDGTSSKPDNPAASQGDQKAAFEDAKKALLEMLVLGKRDPSIGKRIQKGMPFPKFVAELSRLWKEAGSFAGEFEKLAPVGNPPKADEGRASAEQLIKYLLGDKEARAALLENRPSAKLIVASFQKNLGSMRRMQIVNFAQGAARTGARFIGQFAPLNQLGSDVTAIAIDLLEDPRGLDDAFRSFLAVGMRDFVKAHPLTKKQVETLTDIASDEFEDLAVASNVTALLAYAGHPELYDAQVKKLEEKIAKASGQEAVRQLTMLVDLQSVAEKNGDAAKTYRKIVELFKNADDNILGTHYYNLCCSLEKSGDRDGALEALDVSLKKAGKRLAQGTLWIDRDIAEIRKDKRFSLLLDKHGLEWPAGMKPKTGDKNDSKSDGDKVDKFE